MNENEELNYKQLFFQLIFNSTQYNGHCQGQVDKQAWWGLSEDDRCKLLADLEQHILNEYTRETLVVAEHCSDRTGGVYARHWWKRGEHKMGHTDRLLLTIGGE